MTNGLAIAPDRGQEPAEIKRNGIGAGSCKTPRDQHDVSRPGLPYIIECLKRLLPGQRLDDPDPAVIEAVGEDRETSIAHLKDRRQGCRSNALRGLLVKDLRLQPKPTRGTN